jgi:hypothetical protein
MLSILGCSRKRRARVDGIGSLVWFKGVLGTGPVFFPGSDDCLTPASFFVVETCAGTFSLLVGLTDRFLSDGFSLASEGSWEPLGRVDPIAGRATTSGGGDRLPSLACTLVRV